MMLCIWDIGIRIFCRISDIPTGISVVYVLPHYGEKGGDRRSSMSDIFRHCLFAANRWSERFPIREERNKMLGQKNPGKLFLRFPCFARLIGKCRFLFSFFSRRDLWGRANAEGLIFVLLQKKEENPTRFFLSQANILLHISQSDANGENERNIQFLPCLRTHWHLGDWMNYRKPSFDGVGKAKYNEPSCEFTCTSS